MEQAGFEHLALVEIEPEACETLKLNRPHWNVLQQDVRSFSAQPYRGVDLVAGGVPCPPFSIAGKQLGQSDERDLFPEAMRVVREAHPKAVMLENVKGLMSPRFDWYRGHISAQLQMLGYVPSWRLLNASDFGVPQLRPRTVLVALAENIAPFFEWARPQAVPSGTVGEVLYEEMASANWEGADEWARSAQDIAPTLVGGSKKHGGPDLGPTRARAAWLKLGVDGRGLADEPPHHGYAGLPRLTVKMTALLQGFPRDWSFAGRKTASYRQVGNAFPPPVACAVGMSIAGALAGASVPVAAD